MTKIFLFCLGLHFLVDYTLQGWLAQAKCRAWWQEHAPQALYKRDWMCALMCHSIYWTLVTFAPVIWLWEDRPYALCLILGFNACLHALIDDLKANAYKINLWVDQLLHLGQILITVGLLAAVTK